MSNAQADAVLAALSDPGTLRPFPTVAARLLQLPADAELMELAQLIECDPAVSLELLRLANSSLYGFTGQIRSVNHAVVILGFREVRSLALSLASGQVFGGGSKQHGQNLWKHSLGCAAIARCLAPLIPGADADEAFLGGILHDVGKLVFFDVIPDDYESATANLDAYQITDAESDAFGITHQEIGQQCAEQWGLPIELNEVIAAHHDFEISGPGTEVLHVVQTANCLARQWGIGCEPPGEDDEPLPVPELSVPAEDLEQVRTEALSAFEALHSSCAA